METEQIRVEVQPTYKVEQKVYIIGHTPTDDDDDELTYSGTLTIFLTDNIANYVEVAEDATDKPTT